MQHYDYILVGCGFFSAVFAQQAREHGKTCLIIERRNHIGGNCYSSDYEDTNINVHRYGTHIFHTNNQDIWDYINRFTEFNRYQHRVLTTHKNRVYAMPICLGTINAFYNVNLKPHEVQAFLEEKIRPDFTENPTNFEDKAINQIGRDLYEAFFKGYTMKQWDCSPRELPASIFNRLPIRESFHDSYFNDRYQGIPIGGFTPIFERLIEGIPVELGVDFLEDPDYWKSHCGKLVYTGAIDRYFHYSEGHLNWRSVRFEYESHNLEDYQGTSVMNYADVEVPFTRIHEPKHLHLEKSHTPNRTVIIREYSKRDNEDPYYPVNSTADKAIFARYQELAAKEPRVLFGGRLAEYKYYDMHQVIGSALQKARVELGR
ncbi:MAG: UDP-galactopyranose mutase [Candidatus Sumerlaeia bacterium]|nr:UDP-galactopyranose mutase [Candidatus Sumerlaeia bacterium]